MPPCLNRCLSELKPTISYPACSRGLPNGAHSTQGPLRTVDNTGNGVCGTAKATQLYRALACLEAASLGCLKAPLVLWVVGGIEAYQCVNVHWCPSPHHPWDNVCGHDLPTRLLPDAPANTWFVFLLHCPRSQSYSYGWPMYTSETDATRTPQCVADHIRGVPDSIVRSNLPQRVKDNARRTAAAP
jgi:hypothetical protein